jgi:hypothetical protein
MTHKTIDRIIKLASSIANDAEAAVNCRPAVLIEIENRLADAQRLLYDEIVRARIDSSEPANDLSWQGLRDD